MRFCDLPYHILYEYLDYFISQDTSPISGSSLRGPRTGISTSRSEWLQFYMEYSDPDETFIEYYDARMKPLSGTSFLDYNDSNIFKFQKHPSDRQIDEYAKAYIKKDGLFYDWLRFYSSTKGKYVNIYQPYLYIGKVSYFYDSDTYGVHFYGMKDYVMDALPEHNRTDNLKEFAYTYFDKIHQEGYIKLKNIKTLLDASEIKPEYMPYIAGEFGMDFDTEWIEEDSEELELKKRQYLRNLIPLLKRKGTYSSIKIIYDLLS